MHTPPPAHEPIGALIQRYPYLYEHCLLTEGSPYEHQQTIRQLQAKAQRQYEVDLSQYVTYQVRRSQVNRGAALQMHPIAFLQPVKNPTLLSDQELCRALKQFAGKSQSVGTYRDRGTTVSDSHKPGTHLPVLQG